VLALRAVFELLQKMARQKNATGTVFYRACIGRSTQLAAAVTPVQAHHALEPLQLSTWRFYSSGRNWWWSEHHKPLLCPLSPGERE